MVNGKFILFFIYKWTMFNLYVSLPEGNGLSLPFEWMIWMTPMTNICQGCQWCISAANDAVLAQTQSIPPLFWIPENQIYVLLGFWRCIPKQSCWLLCKHLVEDTFCRFQHYSSSRCVFGGPYFCDVGFLRILTSIQWTAFLVAWIIQFTCVFLKPFLFVWITCCFVL